MTTLETKSGIPLDAVVTHAEMMRVFEALKTGGGGGRASLMTFPVIEAEDMPDIVENLLSIAFGDFGRGYLIVDRAGVSVLRDPSSAKPYVLFYNTKRVGAAASRTSTPSR